MNNNHLQIKIKQSFIQQLWRFESVQWWSTCSVKLNYNQKSDNNEINVFNDHFPSCRNHGIRLTSTKLTL